MPEKEHVKAVESYDLIRQRMDELKADRERAERDRGKPRCKKGCGAALDSMHETGCGFTGTVTKNEVEENG